MAFIFNLISYLNFQINLCFAILRKVEKLKPIESAFNMSKVVLKISKEGDKVKIERILRRIDDVFRSRD